jgi:uncharacterized protein YecE (DUF72 family)
MPAPGLSPKGSSEVRHTIVWIGTSGWSYRHWEKTFYPDGQRAREHLPFYARQFCTVELNYSYYRLPERKSFENWRTAVPSEFLFAVKASRYLTHMKKLKDPDEPLRRLIVNAGGLAENSDRCCFSSRVSGRWTSSG